LDSLCDAQSQGRDIIEKGDTTRIFGSIMELGLFATQTLTPRKELGKVLKQNAKRQLKK
jgi:hypothetical protein